MREVPVRVRRRRGLSRPENGAEIPLIAVATINVLLFSPGPGGINQGSKLREQFTNLTKSANVVSCIVLSESVEGRDTQVCTMQPYTSRYVVFREEGISSWRSFCR